MRRVLPSDTNLDATAGDVAQIRGIAHALRRSTPEETLAAIHQYLSSLSTTDAGWNSPNREPRTSTDMLEHQVAWGCSAHAQVACHLARACGIPAILVKTLNLDWIQEKNQGDGRGEGHVYLEVLVDDKAMLWDAQAGNVCRDYDPTQTHVVERRYIYDKGGPDEIILSHHGPKWEAETRCRFPQFNPDFKP